MLRRFGAACTDEHPLALMDTGCGDELGERPSSDGEDVVIDFV